MRGISLAVVGIYLTVVWSIISRSGIDWKAWLIGIVAFALALSRRVNILLTVGLAGLVGYFMYR